MRKRSTPILLTGCLLLLLWTAVSAGYAASGPLTWQVVSTATAVPTYVPSESADDLNREIVYTAAFLTDEKHLAVRREAGDGEAVELIGSLDNGDRVELTGASTVVAGKTWVPIRYEDGGGWVERESLVGTLDPALFCIDPRPEALIASFQDTLRRRDGAALVEIVSPRGLYMSIGGGHSIFLEPDEITGFFDDALPRNWGNNGYSGIDFIGSLAEDVIPSLIDDFSSQNLTMACNDNQDGLSNRSVLYALQIAGYDITDFYSVMRPGQALDWRAWGLAIEYWEDQPRLMGLSGYGWTP